MSQVLNAPSVLIAVGILQPTNAFEIIGLLETMLPGAGEMPSAGEIVDFLKERETMGHVIRVAKSPDHPSMYSLTLAGHRYLTLAQRKVRDKFRFYLLRDARRGRVPRSGDGAQRLVGVSPTVDERTPEKGSVANKIGQRVPSGRSYWPRISRQFDSRTGSYAPSPDAFPEWLSYRTQRQCEVATGFALDTFELDFEGLAACLGVSAKIISQIASRPNRHYNSFPIPKRDGTERIINTPRVFLKVIQGFLADFVLSSLPIHHAVHSFQRERSVLTNADLHVRAKFVGSIDIADFFGSVTSQAVTSLLGARGFRARESRLISKLCCREGVLPQGAPTSPVLSNALLFRFDEAMANHAALTGLSYTRYADDITISGNSREIVVDALGRAREILNHEYGLRLNEQKTRIASSGGQQRVTGIVVNERPNPPRELRRRVRAMFYEAARAPQLSLEMLNRLRGYVAYLKMFPGLADSRTIAAYRVQLEQMKSRPPSI